MSQHNNSNDQQQGDRKANREGPQEPSTLSLQRDILMGLGLTKGPETRPADDEVPQLLQSLLNTGSPGKIRVAALQHLALLGSDAPVDEITACLHDPNAAVRMAAIRTLEQLEPFGIIPLYSFIDALVDPNAYVQATTVQAFITIGPQKLTPSLIEVMLKQLAEQHKQGEQQDNHFVRVKIIQLLGMLGKQAPTQTLLALLQDPAWQIREAAVFAFGDQAALQELTSALYDRDHSVRKAAAFVLKDHPPIDKLLRDLRFGQKSDKAKAARALGELGVRTQPIKQAFLEVARNAHDDSLVRTTVILAMAQSGISIDDDVLKALLHDRNENVSNAAQILQDVLYPEQADA